MGKRTTTPRHDKNRNFNTTDSMHDESRLRSRGQHPSVRENKERAMSQIEEKLAELGITLPDAGSAPKAAGNYSPFVLSGNMVYVSGQISRHADDSPMVGKLGDTFSVEDGAAAARTCAVQLLMQANIACGGDLTRLKKVVKLTGFVNSTSDFTDQPKVIKDRKSVV